MPDTIRYDDSDNRNMYGVIPCPKCGSKFRCPFQTGTIDCDDCGHTVPIKGFKDMLASEGGFE